MEGFIKFSIKLGPGLTVLVIMYEPCRMVFAGDTKTPDKNKSGEGTFSLTPIKMRIFVMKTKIKFVLKKKIKSNFVCPLGFLLA